MNCPYCKKDMKKLGKTQKPGQVTVIYGCDTCQIGIDEVTTWGSEAEKRLSSSISKPPRPKLTEEQFEAFLRGFDQADQELSSNSKPTPPEQ